MGPINGFVNMNQIFLIFRIEYKHVKIDMSFKEGIFDKTKEMQIQGEQTRNDKDIKKKKTIYSLWQLEKCLRSPRFQFIMSFVILSSYFNALRYFPYLSSPLNLFINKWYANLPKLQDLIDVVLSFSDNRWGISYMKPKKNRRNNM